MVTAAYLVTGEIAGTRRRAERLRQEITAQLSDLPRDGRLEIDLSGLTVMSGAFADELVGRLMNDRPGDSSIVFVSDSESVRGKVALVLTRRQTAAWMRSTSDARPVLVGAGSNIAAGG